MKKELEKALRINNVFLYMNAVDKAFLAFVIAMNAYIKAIEDIKL